MAAKTQYGFTLLEVLVVLAIVSLVIAVAGAPTIKFYESARLKVVSQRIAEDIATLRFEAAILQQTLVFPDDFIARSQRGGPNNQEIPPGWKLEGDQIVFLPTGICLGGEITITDAAARSVKFLLPSPYCTPKRL